MSKLGWIEALNEETQWTSEADALDWLYKVTGRRLSITEGAINSFFDTLLFMRELVSSLHFGEPLACDALQARLEGISLAVNPGYAQNSLPLLVARRTSNSDADVLRSVCDTLLLQFSSFLSEAFDSQSTPKIVRCEGLFREGRKERRRLGALARGREAAWRAELSLLEEADKEVAQEIQRCEDLFVFSGKAKFCSDACRFSTFQITKQLKDPGYMKEKQRRYRNRKEKK